MPAGGQENVEEAGHLHGGDQQSEEEPRADEHGAADYALAAGAWWAVHEPGFGGFAAEGQRGQGFAADVEGEQLQDGQGQGDRAAAEGEDEERYGLWGGVGENAGSAPHPSSRAQVTAARTNRTPRPGPYAPTSAHPVHTTTRGGKPHRPPHEPVSPARQPAEDTLATGHGA